MEEALHNSINFLEKVLGHRPSNQSTRLLPYVTLTYAQSFDGKIAGANHQQLALSGPESFAMTHW